MTAIAAIDSAGAAPVAELALPIGNQRSSSPRCRVQALILPAYQDDG